MAKERTEETYPVRSLHDFLFELDKEWSKFRNGSLIALISSALMFVFVVFLILIFRRLHLAFGDFLFLVVAGGLLAYSIYATYAQYRFFNRWERRIGLLMHLEDELIAEKLGEKSQA